MRFLNTTEPTSMGPGAGLEVGNSIYFHEAQGQFSYWGTDDAGRHMVHTLIQSGHIDCLHSYGMLATDRSHAGHALDELDRHGCRLRVWVDHASSPSNFGRDISGHQHARGHGDEVGHPAYHADLTIPFGIRFVWLGRVTSVIGQDAPWHAGGIARGRHPVVSARTLGKEFTKHLFGRCGYPKYAMHGPNRVLRLSHLRDGQCALEFMRSNPHWVGVSACDTARGIGAVLTNRMLSRLVERQGVCVLYTHLGKVADPDVPLGAAAQQAFRTLAERQRSGDILVTTTHRLLQYLMIRDSIEFSSRVVDGTITITIQRANDAIRGTYDPPPDELCGLTFAGPPCRHAEIKTRSGTMVPSSVTNSANGAILTIPWKPQQFPSL
jgi:hypothetical protein